MNRYMPPLLLCLACGAEPIESGKMNDLTLGEGLGDTPVVSILELEDADGYAPNYIDRLTWGEEKIDFIEIHPPAEEPGPSSIMVYRTGPGDQRDIVDLLQENAPVALSPAELWMNITGREDVPAALASDHAAFAHERGRSPDFHMLGELTLEKDGTTDPVIYPAIPGHTWQRRRETVEDISGDGVPRYSCSEVQVSNTLPLIRTGVPTQASACSTAYNEGGWVRTAVFNASSFTGTITQQLCFGTSAPGNWACFAPGLIERFNYSIFDWAVPEAKRMALSVVPPFTGFNGYRALWAVGKSVPQ